MKKKVLTYIIGFLILVLSGIALSFAYNDLIIEGLSKKITFSSSSLSINFNTTRYIKNPNTKLVLDSDRYTEAEQYLFNVYNSSSSATFFKVQFKDVVIDSPLYSSPYYLKYELTKCSSSSDIVCNSNILFSGSVKSNDETQYLGNVDISASTTGYYSLRIWISQDTGAVQNNYMLKKFTARIDIEASNSSNTSLAFVNGVTNIIGSPSLTTPASFVNLGDNSSTLTLFERKNLMPNGYGYYKSNKNFSFSSYNANENAFSTTTSNYIVRYSDEFIPVDTSKAYTMAGSFKATNPNSIYYYGFAEYDIDKQLIYTYNSEHIIASTTTLSQDLNPGDTVVHLTSLAGFTNNLTNSVLKSLIFWNYKDSTGYDYGVETYSRWVYTNIYEATGMNYTDNTITLKNAWTGLKFNAGSSVSQATSLMDSYNYALLSSKKLTNEYLRVSKDISGVLATNETSYNKFKLGTKYIKALILDNYNGSTSGSSTLTFKDIDFYETAKSYTDTIDLTGHEPLRCVNDVCDYIDFKNNSIIRKVGVLTLTTSSGMVLWSGSVTSNSSGVYYYNYNTLGTYGSPLFVSNLMSTHFTITTSPIHTQNDNLIGQMISSPNASPPYIAFKFPYTSLADINTYLTNQSTLNTPLKVYFEKKSYGTESITLPDYHISSFDNDVTISDGNTFQLVERD